MSRSKSSSVTTDMLWGGLITTVMLLCWAYAGGFLSLAISASVMAFVGTFVVSLSLNGDLRNAAFKLAMWRAAIFGWGTLVAVALVGLYV